MVHTSMHMIMHMSVHKVGFVIASKVLWTDSQLNSYCQRWQNTFVAGSNFNLWLCIAQLFLEKGSEFVLTSKHTGVCKSMHDSLHKYTGEYTDLCMQ